MADFIARGFKNTIEEHDIEAEDSEIEAITHAIALKIFADTFLGK